ALRHDPDIIMIGEIRDEKTAKFALEASLTGHLVVSTIHAKNAVGTIDRLLDLNISKNDIAQTLLAIASIQLIPVFTKGDVKRGAIVELIDGNNITSILSGNKVVEQLNMETFEQLKEKVKDMDFYKMIQWMKRRKAYKYFFPIEKQLQYLKHVHFLMYHGYSFKDALDHLYYNTDYEAQTKEIITAFKRGDPLDKAFEHAMFHHSIVAYLQFSHAHESMIDSIKNCVDMVEYRLSYIEKLKKTIRYPLFLLIIIVLLLISLNRYVLPMF